jgi:hypothetical protein
MGTKTTPEQAYQFGRGDQSITSASRSGAARRSISWQ